MTEYVTKLQFTNKWAAFGTIAFGTFVSVLDPTSVNLALPQIANHFGATIPEVQWISLGYGLVIVSLLLPVGRFSDMTSRKGIYLAGFSIYTIGSTLAGLSNTLLSLIALRMVQGVGSCMVRANGMAILISVFPHKSRGKIIGLFLTMLGAGAVVGPILGGAIITLLNWRFIFFLGLPLGLIALVTGWFLTPERTADIGINRTTFDWLGAVLSATALSSILIAMFEAQLTGWFSTQTTIAFGMSIVLFSSFALWQFKARSPLFPLELFRRAPFSYGSAAAFGAFVACTSIFFLMPFYLQGVLGHSPAKTGILMAPIPLFFALAGPISGIMSDKYGWHKFEIGGLILLAASLLTLSFVLSADIALQVFLATLTVLGIGLGAFYSPNSTSILSSVESSHYSTATSFLTFARDSADVIGIAVAITIVTAVMSSQGYLPSLEIVSSPEAGQGASAAFVKGLSISLRVQFLFILFSLLSTYLGRNKEHTLAT